MVLLVDLKPFSLHVWRIQCLLGFWKSLPCRSPPDRFLVDRVLCVGGMQASVLQASSHHYKLKGQRPCSQCVLFTVLLVLQFWEYAASALQEHWNTGNWVILFNPTGITQDSGPLKPRFYQALSCIWQWASILSVSCPSTCQHEKTEAGSLAANDDISDCQWQRVKTAIS